MRKKTREIKHEYVKGCPDCERERRVTKQGKYISITKRIKDLHDEFLRLSKLESDRGAHIFAGVYKHCAERIDFEIPEIRKRKAAKVNTE